MTCVFFFFKQKTAYEMRISAGVQTCALPISGQEEQVVEGLRRVVGDRCPIIGGSSADDDVVGLWRRLGPDGPMEDGIVVGVLFSSGGIGKIGRASCRERVCKYV